MSGPLVLVVLDGFGLGDGGPSDATAAAHAPFFARARREFVHARLETSGEAVGLPPGQMGNSEVGHMTMGAGRVVDQDITRISRALRSGALERSPIVQDALAALSRSGGRLHLLGLVSDGGVHSHVEHLELLLAFFGRHGVAPVLHAFLDGRDTAPDSGLATMRALLPKLEAVGGVVATVIGRYFAMDRDNRWDRVSKAYAAIVCGQGMRANHALAAIEASYARRETDEFVQPTVIDGAPSIDDGDVVLCFNFRSDRAREITNALTGALPSRFGPDLVRERCPALARYVCFTEYDAAFGLPVVFPNETPRRILGELLAERDLPQLRIAETEKYAHVTFFFNCGVETPFPGEDRVLVPSPRDVATYDHKPEMSALQVTDQLLLRLAERHYAFILVNFANPDMVGHTGVLPAAVKAVETIDQCLERVTEAVLAQGGQLLVTADHGNCEQMIDPSTGGPHTAHTTNPVPVFWITPGRPGRTLRDGTLADLAPTVLELLGIAQPAEMTGRSLLV